ncbi:hypothetical protein [Streptomyces sp. NPDC046727]|uniref:hypothetical protein n=1 Tax=Streptomyces sp. NPDC046727 TaxID=3155373 RepID=UPI0033F2C4B8
MAGLVYFKKESMHAGFVRYRFGADPSEMDRRLVLNTVTCASEPVDGHVDYLFLKASRKISSLYEERGSWPERGMSAS